MTIPLVICGAKGRMGRAITDMANHRPDFKIEGSVARDSEMGLAQVLQNLSHRCVIIDFSLASLATKHAMAAARYGHSLIIGTTGHNEEALLAIGNAAKDIPVVLAPNTSLMANLMMVFGKMASIALNNADTAIVDIHHAQKKDAPSGTAKALAAAIKAHQPTKEIDVKSIRKGNVAGEHTVYFFNDFERLELTHRVVDRQVFAEGALLAAQFIFKKPPGLYDMNDVLNLRLIIEKMALSKVAL